MIDITVYSKPVTGEDKLGMLFIIIGLYSVGVVSLLYCCLLYRYKRS